MNRKAKYLELYNKAKGILERENPCDFKDGLCVRERQKMEEALK